MSEEFGKELPQQDFIVNNDSDAEFGGNEGRKKLERQLVWKLDVRFTILIIIYILNHIDRNNVSAARLRGFEEDLHLKGQGFSTLLSIFYVGYIIMQVPSNVFLNYIGRPSIYIPSCMIIWGTLSCVTGVTANFIEALLTRFFLGLVEAAFVPGALFLLSKWYRRDEYGLRVALLFCGNLLSNGFGALVASGILDGMQGNLGYAAWRWLFFIEGALTVCVAAWAIFILPDFPATSRWLSPIEQRLAKKRLEEEVGVSDEEPSHSGSNMEGLVMALTDWKVWWMALSLTSMTISLSFNAFFPTLAKTMGFDNTITLLLCVPPWIVTAAAAFFNLNRHSDKVWERYFHIVGPLLIGILGFIIAISTMQLAARYVSLFLMASSYAGYITFYAWISSSILRPPAKRAVSIAFINAFAQLGNIAGSYIWPTKWGKSYRYSYSICIAANGLAIVMCTIYRFHLAYLNKKLEEEEANGQGKGFRYML